VDLFLFSIIAAASADCVIWMAPSAFQRQKLPWKLAAIIDGKPGLGVLCHILSQHAGHHRA